MQQPTIGFIGLGLMGAPMATNLQRAGHPLVVHDARRAAASVHLQAGARWADTPRAVAESCDVVFTCLPGLAHVAEVLLGTAGVLAGVRSGQAVFELSTGSPEMARQFHAEFAARSAWLLDAPISGGPDGARSRRLAIWVGGDAEAYRRYEPVLLAMADSPAHLGPVGSGLVAKLVHNCASQATQAAIAEAFVLGVKAGAQPLSLWRAIRRGAIGRRRTFDGLATEFLPGHYDAPSAALSVVHKDMKNATGLGRQLGVPTPMADAALADIQQAMDRGWAARDCRAVMLLPQERAGVRIEEDPAAIAAALRDDPPI